MQSNELYLTVLPIIHLGTGEAEQILTLISNREGATEFFPGQVGAFISMFNTRAKYFTGGHILGYELIQQDAGNGRLIVKVLQNVTES